MRILHVTTWKIRCGIAACTESLVEQLDQRGIESTVFPITPSTVHTMVRNDMTAMIEKIAQQARECDLVHIQHEFGFFASPSIVNSIRNFGHLLGAEESRTSRRGDLPHNALLSVDAADVEAGFGEHRFESHVAMDGARHFRGGRGHATRSRTIPRAGRRWSTAGSTIATCRSSRWATISGPST